MKTTFIIPYNLIVLCLLFINNACDKKDCCNTETPPLSIYKLKGDYIKSHQSW